MTERLCPAPDCGKPLVRREGETQSDYLSRETCGFRCGGKLGRSRMKQNGGPTGRSRAGRNSSDQSWRFAGWPKVTGEIDWNGAFARHNLNFKGGRFVTLPKPLDYSPTGNSASLLVEAAR